MHLISINYVNVSSVLCIASVSLLQGAQNQYMILLFLTALCVGESERIPPMHGGKTQK